jgi:hypothetical protein
MRELRRFLVYWLRCVITLMLLAVAAQVTLSQSATPEPTPEALPPVTDSPELLEALASARFEPVNARPLTGQAFTIEFVISLPSGFELVESPQFSNPWGEFELRSVSSLEAESQSDGSTVFRQQLEVVLWEPRDYVTPETFIGYRQTGFGDIQRLPVTPANITVPTVLDFEDLTLRPYKPLVYLPYLSPWVIALAVVVLVALILIIRRLWQRRPRRAEQGTPPPTSAEIALWKLDELHTPSSRYPTPELRMIEAADTLRQYLQTEFDIPLQNTDTTINALQGQLPLTIREALEALLRQADLIKFAGVAITSSERAIPNLDANQYIERCQQWLKAVDQPDTFDTLADQLIHEASNDKFGDLR